MKKQMMFFEKAQTDGNEDVFAYRIVDAVAVPPEAISRFKSGPNTLFYGSVKDFRKMIQLYLVDELNKEQIKTQDMLELVNRLY